MFQDERIAGEEWSVLVLRDLFMTMGGSHGQKDLVGGPEQCESEAYFSGRWTALIYERTPQSSFTLGSALKDCRSMRPVSVSSLHTRVSFARYTAASVDEML